MAKNEDAGILSVIENIKVFSDVTKTLFFIISCVLIGLFFIWRQEGIKDITTPIFWSLACLASGGIVGFLFGIPRVLQDNPAVAISNNNNAANNNATDENNDNNNEKNKSAPLSYRIMVNTNLEQISDWLTKIIVGLGLIELRNVPSYLNSLSVFFSSGLNGTVAAQSLASAIIVYFVIVGFLGVYLMTRIYLAQVFSKADRETQETAMFGGRQLNLQEFGEQVLKKVNDVENEVLKPKSLIKDVPVDRATEETSAGGEKIRVKTILWVDDHPKNNSLDIETLEKRGIEVVLSFTTDDALKKLESRTFDRIISDMTRRMNGKYEDKAGINLLKTIRSQGKDTPFLIYCTENSVFKYKKEAIEAGAKIITSSSTELMKALQLDS
jgi:CheY-like chemotaxis protein